VLEALAVCKSLPGRIEDRDVPMSSHVLPTRLVWDVTQLDAEAAGVQLIYDRLHASGVVIPPPSVHEWPVL